VKILFVACSDVHAVCFHAIAEALEKLGHAVETVAVFPKAENFLASVGRKTIGLRGPLQRLARHAPACDDQALERLAAFEMRISRGRIAGTIARTVAALREYWKGLLVRGEYDRIVINNGEGFLHRVLLEQADGLSQRPKVWYTEAGFFPGTMVIDPEGVNRHGALMDLTVEELPPAGPETDAFLGRWRQGQISGTPRGVRHSVWSHVRSLGMLHPVTCALLGRSPWDMLRLASAARFRRRGAACEPSPDLRQPYVFLPLQVHDDTQVLLNSTHFRDMASLVRHVAGQVPNRLRLVVKPHPADRGRVASEEVRGALARLGDRGVWVEQARSTELAAQAEAVVTLNSTVGLEAVTCLRPTCCLGEAWYAKPGLAQAIARPDDLAAWLTAPTAPHAEAVRRLVSFLRDEYLLPGGFSGMSPAQSLGAAQRIVGESPWWARRRGLAEARLAGAEGVRLRRAG